MHKFKWKLFSVAFIFFWLSAPSANAQTDPPLVRSYVMKFSELDDESVRILQTTKDPNSRTDLTLLPELFSSIQQTELAAKTLMAKYKDGSEELRILWLVYLGCQSLTFELNGVVGWFQTGDPWFLSVASDSARVSHDIHRRLMIREISDQKKPEQSSQGADQKAETTLTKNPSKKQKSQATSKNKN